MTASSRARRLRAPLVGLLSLAVAAVVPAVTAAGPAAAAPTDDLIAWYQLDETSGTVAEDSAPDGIGDGTVVGTPAWGGEGFEFTGGRTSSGNAIELPDDVLRGLEQVTIDLDVWVDPALSGNWALLNLGNRASSGSGYLSLTGEDSEGRYRGSIATGSFLTEQSVQRDGGLATGTWKQVTWTIDGGTVAAPGVARLYEDGRLVASTPVTTSPAALGTPDGSGTHNYLGRSAYVGDLSFQGRMRDVRIYDRALDEAEVAGQTCVTAAQAAEALAVVNADDVRGNLTLPTTGPYGSSVAWSSSAPAVVSTTGEVTRPATGGADAAVTLTAAVTLGGTTVTREVPLTVRAAPAALDPEGYAFAYFTGEGAGGEQIFMGASQGNDPLAYDELNQDEAGVTQPILASTLGEQGLRDPFLIRSPEGDRFYLLATDLRIADRAGGNDFGSAQENGSLSLMVWESTDLVTWSAQRQVQVSSGLAGNTWAPEAFWDDARGEYVVYWASATYPTPATGTRDIETSYQRMFYATTRDFVTFSEARPWVDVRRGPGDGMIDATVVEDGDTYYRVIKDEATFTIRQERSTDLRATVSGTLPTTTSPDTGWQLVAERLGAGQANPWGGTFEQGEGPTIFADNEVDGRYYLFVDQPSYHGGQGYLAFQTDDLASADWRSIPTARLPASPRHGTVIPASAAELAAMRAGYDGTTATDGTPTPGTVVPTTAPRATACDSVDLPDEPPVTTPPVTTPPVTPPPVVTPPAVAPVATVTAPRKVRAGKRPRVSLAVSSAPAGAVASVVVTRTVVRTVDGRTKRKSKTVLATQVPVVGGAATLRLPRLRPGKHVVTTTYAGPGGTTTDRTVIRVRPGATGSRGRG